MNWNLLSRFCSKIVFTKYIDVSKKTMSQIRNQLPRNFAFRKRRYISVENTSLRKKKLISLRWRSRSKTQTCWHAGEKHETKRTNFRVTRTTQREFPIGLLISIAVENTQGISRKSRFALARSSISQSPSCNRDGKKRGISPITRNTRCRSRRMLHALGFSPI